MRYNVTPSKGQNLRMLSTPNSDQQPISTAGEHVNWHIHCGKQFVRPSKIENTDYDDPATQLDRLSRR